MPQAGENHIHCQTHVPHLGCPLRAVLTTSNHLPLRLRSLSIEVTIESPTQELVAPMDVPSSVLCPLENDQRALGISC